MQPIKPNPKNINIFSACFILFLSAYKSSKCSIHELFIFSFFHLTTCEKDRFDLVLPIIMEVENGYIK